MSRAILWLWRRAVWGTKVAFILGMGALAPGAPPPELPPRPRSESKSDDGDHEDEA